MCTRLFPLLLSIACAGGPPDADEPVDLGPAPDVAPSAPVLRRLTVSQYEHAIRDLFGEDVYVPTAPEPDTRFEGLVRLGASQVAISPRGVERYEQAAYIVAEQALSPDRRAAFVPCTPSATVDDDCAFLTLERLGRRAWRRPLTDDELDALVAVSGEAASTLGDFHEGLVFGVAALLQSPDFLLRPEFGEPDPLAPGLKRYTAFELASRLSFTLWDSIPDDELLDAAEAGELDTIAGLEAQVDRMLADPKARRGLRAFADDLLQLGELTRLQKDPAVFIYLREGLFASAREETLRVVEDIVFDDPRDWGELLTTRRTFLDRDLAMLYGVPAPVREGFGLTELPEDGPRAGLLGHVSFLALQAHPTSTSATRRGKFVRGTLLCDEPRPPPAGVDTSIPEPSADARTLRERIAVHLENPACAGCHAAMDPIGLGLENFDGLGVWRETENGVRIDASGDLDGAPFDGLVELARAVRGHEDFYPCAVRQAVRAALGRNPADGEAEAIEWLVARFEADEHRFQGLWRDLVTSPLFRRVGEVE